MKDFFYLNTNEKRIQINREGPRGNTWVGVSALFNFDALSRLGTPIQSAILVDHNRATVTFLKELVDYMSEEADGNAVIAFIQNYVTSNASNLFPSEIKQTEEDQALLQLNRFLIEINDEKSFLSRKDTYKKIHELARSNKIQVKQLDLTNPDEIHALRAELNVQSLTAYFTQFDHSFHFKRSPISLEIDQGFHGKGSLHSISSDEGILGKSQSNVDVFIAKR